MLWLFHILHDSTFAMWQDRLVIFSFELLIVDSERVLLLGVTLPLFFLLLFGLWVKNTFNKIANHLFEGQMITEEDDGFSTLQNYFLQ